MVLGAARLVCSLGGIVAREAWCAHDLCTCRAMRAKEGKQSRSVVVRAYVLAWGAYLSRGSLARLETISAKAGRSGGEGSCDGVLWPLGRAQYAQSGATPNQWQCFRGCRYAAQV